MKITREHHLEHTHIRCAEYKFSAVIVDPDLAALKFWEAVIVRVNACAGYDPAGIPGLWTIQANHLPDAGKKGEEGG